MHYRCYRRMGPGSKQRQLPLGFAAIISVPKGYTSQASPPCRLGLQYLETLESSASAPAHIMGAPNRAAWGFSLAERRAVGRMWSPERNAPNVWCPFSRQVVGRPMAWVDVDDWDVEKTLAALHANVERRCIIDFATAGWHIICGIHKTGGKGNQWPKATLVRSSFNCSIQH